MRPLRSGDFVEVRPFSEIAATLDARGELQGLPFMPEMLPYCGKRFAVWKRANKTCDESSGGAIRRVRNAVHLKELRCGGEAHDGCDAGCLFFWNEQWLKPVASLQQTDAPVSPHAQSDRFDGEHVAAARDAIGRATFHSSSAPNGAPLYSCQSTQIARFSQPLRWWDFRQYVRDFHSRNVTLRQFAGGIFIGLFNKFQDLRGGRSFDAVAGPNTRTPQASLNLVPGDVVQIKSRDEIASTLDRRGRNRGLSFRPTMVPYCGKQYRVLRRVSKIIDPRSRRMISLRQSCLILDGVVCAGEMRRFCPRAAYTFWRDIWLKKAPEQEAVCTSARQPASGRLAPAPLDPIANTARILRSVGVRFLSKTLVFEHTALQTDIDPDEAIPGATWQLADANNVREFFRNDPGRSHLFLRFLHSGHLGVLLVRNGDWIAYGWASKPGTGRPPHLPRWAELLGAYWIFHCHTKSAFRGRGMCKLLLNRIVALAHENGPGPVYIDALPGSVTFLRAILSAGFSPRGVTTTLKLWLPGAASIPLRGNWLPDQPHPGTRPDRLTRHVERVAARY